MQQLFDNCFEGIGCSDPLALNYDPEALFDFGGACLSILSMRSIADPAYQSFYESAFLVEDSITVEFEGLLQMSA